jgi:hypothetical protein
MGQLGGKEVIFCQIAANGGVAYELRWIRVSF